MKVVAQTPTRWRKTAVGAVLLSLATAVSLSGAGTPSAVLEPSGGEFWAGELFPITFKVLVPEQSYQSTVGELTWTSDGLAIEDWTKPERGRGMVDGTWMMVQNQHNRGYGPKAGEITLASASQKVTMRGASTGGSFQQGGVIVQVPVASDPVTLTIKPLPEPAPAGFAGAVGQFELKSTVTTEKLNTGESVTWTLELSGTGNWPQIRRLPERGVAKSFEVVNPGVRRTSVGGAAFDATLVEDLILVPRMPGSYTLGPVNFVYFDPAAAAYRTLTMAAHTVQVIGAVTDDLNQMPKVTGVAVPDSPPVLPLDPTVGAALGLRPLAAGKWWVLGLTPVVLLMIFWFGLAARRRHATDPLRGRRLARARVAAILADLETNGATATAEQMRAKLFGWEKASAELLGLALATPTGPAVEAALRDANGRHTERWLSLWGDADRAIFSAVPTVPSDWLPAAYRLLVETRVPRVPVLTALHPRNLLPFAVVAGACLVALPQVARAADAGEASYLSGDFAAAEAHWQKLAVAEPLNGFAHYNRSLALAQMDRWSEAAAESLVALCLAPNDERVRWQLTLSLDRAGIDQTLALALAHRPGRYRIATLFSVGGWAIVLGLASTLGCAALGLLLWNAYAGKREWAMRWPLIPAGVAALVIFAAVMSRDTYGLLGETTTAVVAQTTSLYSVPTEANAAQKTVPLPAGSLATGGRTFLGWTQLAFPNGQTGWVRTDQLLWIYR